jgi:hypothetical protein
MHAHDHRAGGDRDRGLEPARPDDRPAPPSPRASPPPTTAPPAARLLLERAVGASAGAELDAAGFEPIVATHPTDPDILAIADFAARADAGRARGSVRVGTSDDEGRTWSWSVLPTLRIAGSDGSAAVVGVAGVATSGAADATAARCRSGISTMVARRAAWAATPVSMSDSAHRAPWLRGPIDGERAKDPVDLGRERC